MKVSTIDYKIILGSNVTNYERYQLDNNMQIELL